MNGQTVKEGGRHSELDNRADDRCDGRVERHAGLRGVKGRKQCSLTNEMSAVSMAIGGGGEIRRQKVRKSVAQPLDSFLSFAS